MRVFWLVGAAIAMGFCCPVAGFAQMTTQERRIEEQARAQLDPEELAILNKEPRFVVDYGAWVNYRFTDFTDDDNEEVREDSTDATHAVDERAWIRATLRPPADGSFENEHSLYVRLKDKQTWRDPGDANSTFDHNGPHVDYAFLSMDVRPLWLQLGRRLYNVGQGIAYSNVGDGAELLASFATWSVMGLMARTLPHEDNLDLSVPGGKQSGRTFIGAEGRYIGIPNRGLYAFVLIQRNDSHEEPEDLTQDFDYDSEYYGLGSEGTLLPNLRYAAEWIFEDGTSRTSGTNDEADVDAIAADVSLTYDVQWTTQPTVYAEYAFGSGDPDRANVTDTISGNVSGRDKNFLYFGYLPTGYALSPRLSNLHMVKVGLALNPLEEVAFLNAKELTTAIDYYRFYKEDAHGGVFDTQASLGERDLGFEVDVTLSWPILSDVSLGVEYGFFKPGDAYPAATNDSTTYLSVRVTSTF